MHLFAARMIFYAIDRRNKFLTSLPENVTITYEILNSDFAEHRVLVIFCGNETN